MYSYPAMTANVGDMAGYTGTTQSLGADIASERTAPSRACQGDLGMSHQDWQAQWNQAMEALARARVVEMSAPMSSRSATHN